MATDSLINEMVKWGLILLGLIFLVFYMVLPTLYYLQYTFKKGYKKLRVSRDQDRRYLLDRLPVRDNRLHIALVCTNDNQPDLEGKFGVHAFIWFEWKDPVSGSHKFAKVDAAVMQDGQLSDSVHGICYISVKVITDDSDNLTTASALFRENMEAYKYARVQPYEFTDDEPIESRIKGLVRQHFNYSISGDHPSVVTSVSDPNVHNCVTWAAAAIKSEFGREVHFGWIPIRTPAGVIDCNLQHQRWDTKINKFLKKFC